MNRKISTKTDKLGKEENALEELFKSYCRMDPISKEKEVDLLPLTQIEKWFEDAEILDSRNVTTTDIGLCYFKFQKRALSFKEFLRFLNDLAKTKNMDLNDIKKKLEFQTNLRNSL